MAAEIVMEVPVPPTGLGPNGRLHWRAKNALKQDYMRTVCIVTGSKVLAYQREGNGFMERPHVTYDWYSTHQVDADNGIGRLKPVLDYLQGRIITNDANATLTYRWHKAATKAEERVVVTVTPIPEHRGRDHKGVERDCIQEWHFCGARDTR
jgi:hypothetical protein